MIIQVHSDIYGTYNVDYCVHFSRDILCAIGVLEYIKASDAFDKVWCGKYTYSRIKEDYENGNYNFDFLMGWPFKDVNEDYIDINNKWKKLPIAINRSKVEKLLNKYPIFRYTE